MNINFKDLVNEAGYARTVNIMRGLVPTVNTLAFLTAENPNGIKADAATNKLANQKLEKKLRSMNLGFKKISGHYGGPEKSFFIPNITKEEALDLGKEFNQESIIFGEKSKATKNNKSYDGMTFSLIYTDNRYGQVISKRDVFINMNDAEDYYTEVKGRKFQIPFFDDDYASAQFEPSSGAISKQGINESLLTKLELQSQIITEAGRTPKSRWINRGQLLNLLKQSANSSTSAPTRT